MSIETDGTHVNELDLDSRELPLPELPPTRSFREFRKAIVAVLATIVQAAALFGLNVDTDTALVTLAVNILAATGVYMARNDQPVVPTNLGRDRIDD